jgi:hypothetical protein
MYHCQIQYRVYFDKEENWCDDFELQMIDKKGIIKKIARAFGFRK